MMFGSKTFNADNDIPDLSGKVILVTGGANFLLVRIPQHELIDP